MKQIAVQLCELVLCAVVILFCMQILSGGRKELDVLALGRELALKAQHQEPVSENGSRLSQLMDMPEPQVETDDTVYLTGENYRFLSHIKVRQGQEDDWTYAEEASGFSVEILSVTGEPGKETGSLRQKETGDFSWKNGEICFYQSGRYTVELRITGPYGRYRIQKITVPVEEA